MLLEDFLDDDCKIEFDPEPELFFNQDIGQATFKNNGDVSVRVNLNLQRGNLYFHFNHADTEKETVARLMFAPILQAVVDAYIKRENEKREEDEKQKEN